MAQVPLQSFASVAPNQTPPSDYQNIQANPAAFGALEGAATQRLGASLDKASDDLTQVALMKQQRFNQIASDQAFNEFQTAADNLTYGNPADPTAAPGLYTLRGADALRAGPAAVKTLADTREKIKAGLQNDAQRLQFEQASRRLVQYKSAEISRHLDQQADVYGMAVNKATMENAARSAGLSWNSDEALMHAIQDSRSGAVRNVQTQYGQSPDPEIVKNAISASDNYVLRSAIDGAAAQNPQRAQQILDTFGAHLDPLTREQLTQHLKGVNSAAIANSAVMSAIGAPSASIADAIHGQESGGRSTSPTSVNGARGGWQIQPATFQQYALPGEKIDNPTDNEAVGRRIVDDLSSKYAGDPARVAVGYFSGPGNVAPPGSPTPWIQDKRDGNGTSTSQYVNGVLSRLGRDAGGTKPIPVGNTGLPDYDAALAHVLGSTADNPQAQSVAIAQLNRLYAGQKKAAADAAEKAANPLVTQMIVDPSKIDPIKDIANNPAFNSVEKAHYSEMLNTRLREAAAGDGHDEKTYGKGFWNLQHAVTADPGDPGRITDPHVLSEIAARGDGQLTVAGYDKLVATMQSKKSATGEADTAAEKLFWNYAKQQITGSHTGPYGDLIPDPKGDLLFLKFAPAYYAAIDAGKKEGFTLQQMLNPADKAHYIGDKLIAAYRRPMAERMKDMNDAMASQLGQTGTAQPGEEKIEVPDLTTQDGIIKAYRAGKISRETAKNALIGGGFATAAPPASVVPTNE